jgi:hypothetical protein
MVNLEGAADPFAPRTTSAYSRSDHGDGLVFAGVIDDPLEQGNGLCKNALFVLI